MTDPSGLRVVILYYAVPNKRKRRGADGVDRPDGWVPQMTVSGRRMGGEFGTGTERDEAVAAAAAWAAEESLRWVGDYVVSVAEKVQPSGEPG